MFPGMMMLGAKARLLPLSLPFRFFLSAIVLHVAGWATLLAGADLLPGFQGGLGPGLAGLHLITLGVLVMTAMGAALQLLPVATRRPLGPLWACHLCWWLYAPGVVVLCLGLGGGWAWAMHGGGALSVAGLVIFALLVGRNLLAVDDMPGVTRHVWLALAALVVLAVLGLLLVADVQGGFLALRAPLAAAHAIVAGYGFMGSLALGFSYVLVPMFVLSQPVADGGGQRTALWLGIAVTVTALGAALGMGVMAALGGMIGLAVVGIHLRALFAAMATRMRKRLEDFFRLVRLAWILLPASMVAGMALALGNSPELAAPLWGWLLVFGWLLSFVTAILQRIMPFLASMHSGGADRPPVLMSQLVSPRFLLLHGVMHAVALALVSAGLLAQSAPLVRAGAAAGLIGALAFAYFAILVVVRWRAHQMASVSSPR